MKPSNLSILRRRFGVLTGGFLAGSLFLVGCTSQGGGTTTPGEEGPSSSAGVEITVIGANDPFFSTVKNGVTAASKSVEAAGGKVTYLAAKDYNNLGPDMAKLLKTAIAQEPDGIAVPDWAPDAQDGPIKEALAAGIEVVLYNAGNPNKATELGALQYVGSDEVLAGAAAATALSDDGAKHVMCVNTLPGSAGPESRCKGVNQGMEKAGGLATSLNLPSTTFNDQTAVAQAIKSAIQQDDSIDGIVTMGAVDADSAEVGLAQLNATDRVKLISFDLSTNVLNRIKDGKQLGAIDQQPYAQGYYAVSTLFQKTAYGIDLATKPILTGPLVITEKNVDEAQLGTTLGSR
jgi:simple sugar transport system substrate-binding protein